MILGNTSIILDKPGMKALRSRLCSLVPDWVPVYQNFELTGSCFGSWFLDFLNSLFVVRYLVSIVSSYSTHYTHTINVVSIRANHLTW